jgi:polyisoprenoid-binding protein YceI
VVEASIDSSSLTTRQPQREEHLKSDDFLHAAKYILSSRFKA